MGATLFADVEKASLSAYVTVKPDTYSVIGVSVKKPDIDNLPTTNEVVKLAKARNGSGKLYAYQDVYLYYYFVGENGMSLSVTCSAPLTKEGSDDVIQYSISFGSKPTDNWDGGEFKISSSSSSSSTESVIISSNTAAGYSKTATATTKSGTSGQKVLAVGIWPITIFTGSIEGLTISSNEKYSGAIYLEITSNS